MGLLRSFCGRLQAAASPQALCRTCRDGTASGSRQPFAACKSESAVACPASRNWWGQSAAHVGGKALHFEAPALRLRVVCKQACSYWLCDLRSACLISVPGPPGRWRPSDYNRKLVSRCSTPTCLLWVDICEQLWSEILSCRHTVGLIMQCCSTVDVDTNGSVKASRSLR